MFILKQSWVGQPIDGLMGLDAIYVDEIKQYIECPHTVCQENFRRLQVECFLVGVLLISQVAAVPLDLRFRVSSEGRMLLSSWVSLSWGEPLATGLQEVPWLHCLAARKTISRASYPLLTTVPEASFSFLLPHSSSVFHGQLFQEDHFCAEYQLLSWQSWLVFIKTFFWF